MRALTKYSVFVLLTICTCVIWFTARSGRAATLTHAAYWTVDDVYGNGLLTTHMSDQDGDTVLSVRIVEEKAGWFPAWYVELAGDYGIPEGKHGVHRLGPVVLLEGDTYETRVSFNGDEGYVSLRISNRTTDETLHAAWWPLSHAPSQVVATADSSLQTVSGAWYEPLELTWDVGVIRNGMFEARQALEPTDTVALRIRANTEGTGRFRAVLHHSTGTLPAVEFVATSGESVVQLPAQSVPVGPARVVLEHLAEGKVRGQWEEHIVFGLLRTSIHSVWVDEESRQLRATLRLQTDSLLHGINMNATAHMEAVTGVQAWSADQKYTDVEDTRGALGRVMFLQSGTTNISLGFPLPDTPAVWQVRFRVSVRPELEIQWMRDDIMFSTISPIALAEATGKFPMERNDNTIRLCTYNILGFQGYPEETAAVALGAPDDERRIEHYGQVFRQLDCDITGIQEGGSVDMIRRLAAELGMHSAVYPSATIYMGGLISTFPIKETRLFNDPNTGGGPFSRFGGASLVDIKGTPVWIVNIHAYPHTEEMRRQEARVLADNVDKMISSGEHIVVLGDFNSRPGGVLHNVLTERGFVNALEINSKNGVPSIDHIYVSENLASMIGVGWIVREPGYRLSESEGPGIWVHSDHVPTLVNMNWELP